MITVYRFFLKLTECALSEEHYRKKGKNYRPTNITLPDGNSRYDSY
jgi:hypothetical protein